MIKTNSFHLFSGSVVKIFSCTDCNTKCSHCYVLLKGNFIKAKLDEVVDNLSERFEVRINGTEPLLHREYLDAIKKSKTGLVLTNGLVFKDNYDYISTLSNYDIKTIGISYHFDIHDSISKVSKEYLDQLFQEIIKRGLNVQIMTTITSKNYDKVFEFCDYCYKNRIKKIRFTNFIKQGNATKLDDELILDEEKLQKFLGLVDEARKIYSKEELEIQRCGSFGKNNNSNKVFNCGAGIDSVVLSPDLNVYPCLFFAKPGNEIGYYKDGNIYIMDDYVSNTDDCMAILKLNKLKRR